MVPLARADSTVHSQHTLYPVEQFGSCCGTEFADVRISGTDAYRYSKNVIRRTLVCCHHQMIKLNMVFAWRLASWLASLP